MLDALSHVVARVETRMMPRERANMRLFERLDEAVRDMVPDGDEVSIFFEPNATWSGADDAGGYYVGTIGGTRRSIHVRVPDRFDARDVSQAFGVANACLHEATHDRQYQTVRSESMSEVEQAVSLSILPVICDTDPGRYHLGYWRSPFEVEARISGVAWARDVLSEMYPGEDVDAIVLRQARSEFARVYGTLDEGGTIAAATDYRDFVRAARGVFDASVAESVPSPCDDESLIGRYLASYASEDFIDAWRDARDESDRNKLTVAGIMAYRHATGLACDEGSDARKWFGWSGIDWTLSGGGNAMQMTGLFDESGRLIEGASASPGVPYSELRWMSDLDVTQRLIHWLGAGDGANAHVEYADGGRGRVDGQRWEFPDGTVRLFHNVRPDDVRLLEAIADGSMRIVEHDGCNPPPSSVALWMTRHGSDMRFDMVGHIIRDGRKGIDLESVIGWHSPIAVEGVEEAPRAASRVLGE